MCEEAEKGANVEQVETLGDERLWDFMAEARDGEEPVEALALFT